MRSVSRSPSHSAWWFITAALLAVLLATLCPPGLIHATVVDAPDTLHSATDTTTVLALEDILENSLGLEMDQDLFERLIWLRDHPIDLNETDRDALLSIPGVSSAEVDAIQRHRRTHGAFRETLDLAGVEGVTARTWDLVRPFVTVSPRRLALLDFRARTICPLQGSPEADTTYLGSTVASYGRLIFSPSRGWECGAVFLAGEGERLEDGFLSGYVQHESSGFVRRVIVGDFAATAGSGLIWGQALRRDASIVSLMSGYLSPHRSSGEQGFVRGIGASVALPIGSGEARLHVLVSRTPCSATVDNTDEITSLAAGGIFNTSSTLERKNAGHFSSLGGRLEFLAPGKLRLGMTALRSLFDHSIRADRPFEISGKDFGSIGVDGVVSTGPARCAMEYAVTPEGTGISASIDMSIGHGCATHILFRRCEPGFHSLLGLGGGFGDAIRNTNEVRWSMEVSPSSDSYLHWDVVQFRKPWRTALELFPIGGREIAGEAGLRLAKGFQLTLRGEERWAEHSVKTNEGGRSVMNEPRRRFQCTGNFTRGAHWHVRGRIEILKFLNPVTGSDENGWLASGDVRWEPVRWLAISARVTIFQSDSYDSRLYAIESNVDGLGASKLLTGTGRRWYCLVVCRPLPSLRVSTRYASTEHVIGARSLGRESQLTLQVDFQIDPP